MGSLRQFVSVVPAVWFLLVCPSEAQAQAVVADACHHIVPNGATVYHPSGEVYLHNMLIATYPDSDCRAFRHRGARPRVRRRRRLVAARILKVAP
jgi:hypothetical protein